MRLRAVPFAASLLLVSAPFTASFAQTAAVSEKTFDWIFFAIIGIPFVLALGVLFIEGAQQIRSGRDQTARSWPPFTETK